MRHPELRQIRDDRGGVVESELRSQLHPVGAGENGTAMDRGRHCVGPRIGLVRPRLTRATSTAVAERGSSAAPLGSTSAGFEDGFVLHQHDQRSGGVDHHFPRLAVFSLGELELHRLEVGIEQEQERIIGDAISAAIRVRNGIAVEEDIERACPAVVPVLLAHDIAVWIEPDDVIEPAKSAEGAALEIAAAVKDRVFGAKG